MTHFSLKSRSILRKILASLIVFFVFTLVAEFGFRGIRFLVKGPRIPSSVTYDTLLGWHLNVQAQGGTKRNACGERVVTKKYFDPYILKEPTFPNNPRVLFLGDSFTQAHEVSSGEAYFDVFESLAPNEYSVYAAGIGGFGNLQEYLLLQRIYDEIEPDIVIWQLHSNDVSNNVYGLDSGSFYNNQRPRPYLNIETGQIYFKNPGFFLFDVSHLFRFLFFRILVLDRKYDLNFLDTVDKLIAPSEDELPKLINQGFLVLDIVLKQAKSAYPATVFFGFSATIRYDKEYESIFKANDSRYFLNVASLIAESREPTNCLPLDPHWNHYGNKVAGTLLYHMLTDARSRSSYPKCTPRTSKVPQE